MRLNKRYPVLRNRAIEEYSRAGLLNRLLSRLRVAAAAGEIKSRIRSGADGVDAPAYLQAEAAEYYNLRR